MIPGISNDLCVYVLCPFYGKVKKFYVKHLEYNSKHVIHPNGCDDFSGLDVCEQCCLNVFQKLFKDFDSLTENNESNPFQF